MVDQSYNLKDKLEEMIQTAVTAQELYAKAALVDHEKLAQHQAKAELVDGEECLKAAFDTDVRPIIQEWRKAKGLGENPLDSFRNSGYTVRIRKERAEKSAAIASA
jgi:L-rhamnose isomerase / sugar isomerase